MWSQYVRSSGKVEKIKSSISLLGTGWTTWRTCARRSWWNGWKPQMLPIFSGWMNFSKISFSNFVPWQPCSQVQRGSSQVVCPRHDQQECWGGDADQGVEGVDSFRAGEGRLFPCLFFTHIIIIRASLWKLLTTWRATTWSWKASWRRIPKNILSKVKPYISWSHFVIW